MATCTTKSRNKTSWISRIQFSTKRALLFCLAFIWLSAFNEPNHFKNISEATSMVAFEDCENNLLTNGNFEYNHSNWSSTSNALQGVASSYTTDGNFHAWLLPLVGTAEFYQDISTTAVNQDFSLMVNAGVDDPSGQHTVGLQFMDCLLYTSPSPRDRTRSRMPSSA